MKRILISIDEHAWNWIANDGLSENDVNMLASVVHINKKKTLEEITDLLEQEGEGLLDDDGVDPEVAKSLAKAIMKLFYKGG